MGAFSFGAKEDLLADEDAEEGLGSEGLEDLEGGEALLGDKFPLPPREGINRGVSADSSDWADWAAWDCPPRAAPLLRVKADSSSSPSTSSISRKGDGVMTGGRGTLFRVLRFSCLLLLSSELPDSSSFGSTGSETVF